jgi:hypothetical protein
MSSPVTPPVDSSATFGPGAVAQLTHGVKPKSGLITPGNIDLKKRPTVHNKNGSISTVRSITVTQDGKAYLIPTVVGNRVVSNRAAIKHWQQTGEHLGVFTDEKSADQYAVSLHNAQAKEYAQPERPVPALQQHNFQGGINQFNERVQSVHDSYTQAYGVAPSPALTFDLATSPVDAKDFHRMFTVPQSQFAARNRGVLTAQADDHLHVRKDGLLVKPSPPGLPPADAVTKLHAQFPTVQMGMLPIPGGDKIMGAFAAIGAVKGNLAVQSGGMTLAQAQDVQRQASQGIPVDPAQKALSEKVLRTGNAVTTVQHSLTTVRDAQTELNKAMGTKLPVDGTFNDDWLKALSNWMKTRDYFQRAAVQQATDAGFKDYGSYLKAWKAKQHAVSHNGAFQFFLNALPMHVFSDGGNPLQVLKHLETDMFLLSNPQFSPSYPLHSLTRSAGDALAVVGGTVSQAKAYAQAGAAFAKTVDDTRLQKGGTNYDLALRKAKEALVANPSWLHIFAPGTIDSKDGRVAVLDQITNLAGDILLLRKPAFTGERVLPGSQSAARASSYLDRSGTFSFDYLKQGKLGRAAAMLEGGPGAEQFVGKAAKLVKDGKLSREQYLEHLSELYATGNTTLATGDVSGAALSSLRQGHLNTPTALKQGIQKWLRDRSDAFDAGLRRGGRPGTAAADFTSFVRSEFSHAAPKNAARGYFDPKLPERVHDFALRNFKDANLANSFESALIRARATENVQKIQAVEEKLQGLYYKKFPVGDGAPIKDDPFKAQLESESASRFHFPGGNQKEVSNPFDRIAQRAKGITQGLNAISAKHRLIILSGFPLNLVPVAGKAVAGRSLFWKHMVGDTTRRFVGGDTIIGTGLGGTKKEVAALVNADPSLARQWGAFIDRTTNSETRYLTASGEKAVPEFDTAARFGDKAYMRGAGGYVRRMLDDHALAAYRASTPGNLQPLVDLILKNKTYRALFNKAYKVDTTQGVATLAQRLEYAQGLFTRYRELEDAAVTANSSLDDALTVLRTNRGGKADDALGKWISGNKVGLTVKHALVEQGSSFDQTTSEYIKHIMVFNKLNRGGMAKNIAAGVYDDLKAAGWEDKVALRTAMDVAEKQTVYHMLDFANMLQAEQDLRWLSYFATKHRLYWKWVLGTFVRNPGSAAAIEDAKQHLDARGNLNFTVPLGPLGDKWSVPAARLFWVPGKEYSEVAPTTNFLLGYVKGGFSIQAGVSAVAGTFGNVLTRSDTMLHLLSTAAAIEAGKLPGTYASATKNLDPSTQSKLNRAINHYQQDYFAEHGHYAPERQAVLRSLWRVGAEEGWRANLPLPVVPQSTTGNDTQKLLDGFMRLTDPAKKSKYLDDHPELAAQFGVSKNPADYQHYRTYWSQYTQALDQYHGIRQHLFEQAQKTGYTVEIDAVRRKAGADFQKVFDQLKRQDLAQTDPARRKEMNGENLGLWGQQVSADPLVDPKTALTTLFPNIDPRQLAAAIPSQTVKDAKMNLRLLSDPKYVAAVFADNPGDAKTYKRFLLQFIDDFRSYPHDALGKVQTKYVQEHVNIYWQHITGQLDHIATLGRGDKDLAYAKLRVWKDTQDKPVTVDGIRFPSPVALAWASLPPDERTKRLAGVAGGSWDHLADYEKRLLGVETPKGMSAAWLDYQESIAAYRDKYPGANLDKTQIQFLAKAENKQHPGFLKDWVFAQQPTVDRLEKTALFQNMPADARRAWDAEIAASAKKIAAAFKSGGYNSAELRKAWKDYVHTDVPAFLDKNPALKRWVQPYLLANPDFFTSLPVK